MRYFAAGEYGEISGREHYHLIIFSPCQLDLKDEYINGNFVCTNSPFHAAWHRFDENKRDLGPYGHVDVRYIPSLNDGQKIAQYVAGYILKKLTYSSKSDGRNPEFMLCSRGRKNEGGIGLSTNIVQTLGDSLAAAGVTCMQRDKIHMLRFNGKLWPMCPTLREKIQIHIGGPVRGSEQRATYLDAAALDEVTDPYKYVARKAKVKEAMHMAERALKTSNRSKKL